jgi:energy-coupling factor transporter ATP-binding protein EcfA2
LDIQSKALLEIHVKAFFCIVVLLFLKGLDSNLDLNLQKLIVLTGFGGSGKSTAVQWFKEFLKPNQTHIGAVENLTRPFETFSFLMKKLLIFNEVPLAGNKGSSIQTMNKLLNLSGDREIRGEEKFGQIFNFAVEFLVVMNSNFKLKAESIEHYVALKRRVIEFNFDRFIRIPDEALLTRLTQEASEKKPLILLFISEVDNIKGFFNGLDLEHANVIHAEYKSMDRRVDPYFSFLCQVIRERRPNDTCSPMTISQLRAFFVQYSRQRKDSRIPILDLEE